MNELAEIISSNENQIRTEWIRDMNKSVQRPDLISKTELDEQSRTLLAAIAAGVKGGGVSDIGGPAWTAARETLQDVSASRARQGFWPSEVATFVLSLKQPLFGAIRRDLSKNLDKLFEAVWSATELLDSL